MRRPLTLALAAASVAAAALALLPWLPESARSARPAAAPGAAEDTPALLALPPLAALGETRERPLFSPSRRPAPGAAAAAEGALDTRYRLEGLIAVGGARRAVIAAVKGGHTETLAEGDTLDGWRLTRIASDHVDFASPAGAATLRLNAAGAAKP